MRYLILSDVHGNDEALRAVLAHAARKRRDAVLFLGDAVGYGAAPNQVLERLRRLRAPVVSVRGNHDRVVLDPAKGLSMFNDNARWAAAWTGRALTPANRRALDALPAGPRTVEDGLVICHGTPADEDEYVFSESEARASLAATEAGVVLYGHTHVPCIFELAKGGPRPSVMGSLLRGSRISVDLDPDRRYLLNPGSVGQPRDRDPRASYALYDSTRRRFILYRVEYDVEAARRRILSAGLPEVLGDRLRFGA